MMKVRPTLLQEFNSNHTTANVTHTMKFINLHLAATAFLFGFLHGIFAYERVVDDNLIPSVCFESSFFSENLGIEKGAKTMSDSHSLLRALQADFKTVNNTELQLKLVGIRTKKNEWVSRRKLYGRKELLDVIGRSIETGGKLVCLLGARESGKTTLSRHLRDRINKDSSSGRKVLLVNMKHDTDLTSAVRESMTSYYTDMQTKDSNTGVWKGGWNKVLHFLSNIVAGPHRDQGGEAMVNLKQTYETSVNPFKKLLSAFGPNYTLVIDEAENFFTSDDQSQVLQLLYMLGNNTKVPESRVSAVFISSDVTFPERLRALNYDVDAITTFVYAGEVNLMDTSNLLYSWGFGANAVRVIIGAYGGHLHDITEAVDFMCHNTAKYDFNVVLSLDEKRALGRAAESVYNSMRQSTTSLHELLTCLIRTGHATYDPYNPEVLNFLAELAQQKARIFAPVVPGAVVIGHSDVHPQDRAMGPDQETTIPIELLTSATPIQIYTPSVHISDINTLHCRPSVNLNHEALLVMKSSYRMALARSYWNQAANHCTMAACVLERIKGFYFLCAF